MSAGEWWRCFEEASARHKQELQPLPVFVSRCWHLMGDQTPVSSLLPILMCAHLCTLLLADKSADHVTGTPLHSIFTDASIITLPPHSHVQMMCGFSFSFFHTVLIVKLEVNFKAVPPGLSEEFSIREFRYLLMPWKQHVSLNLCVVWAECYCTQYFVHTSTAGCI